jgi:hypothetical protein
MQITSPAGFSSKQYKSWKDFATKNKERLTPRPSLGERGAVCTDYGEKLL